MSQTRRHFSAEFKYEAVRQLVTKEVPISELALQLGVPRNRLYKWKEQVDQHGDNAFPGHGGRRPKSACETADDELHKELKRLREENAILKKAAAFFAREMK